MAQHFDNCEDVQRDLGRVKSLLEGGGEDAPGLVSRVATIERVIFGKEMQEGMAYKVNVLWRMHVWVLCTLSGLAGFALRELVRLVWKV